MYLSTLYYYPVKSLAGIQAGEANIGSGGFMHDRRWMLVDENLTFVTQRQYPHLARVTVLPTPDGWLVQAPGQPDLRLRSPPEEAPRLVVNVWRDRVVSCTAGQKVADWFSRYIGVDGVQLVYMPETTTRRVDQAYAPAGEQVSFADGFPFLLISQASLDDLNDRMQKPLPMSRFRPNLVVQGSAAYAEDDWQRIRIGELTFRVVKPCSRCKVTTVDPFTAQTGKEPLQTLASYRSRDNEVWFGTNLVHDGRGTLHVGDAVEVLA
jgi:hypothetical protein